MALLVVIPLIFPEKMIPKMIFNVIPMATPVTEVPLPPPPAPKVAAIKPKVTPPPPEPVKEVAVVEPIRQPKIRAKSGSSQGAAETGDADGCAEN